LVQRSRPNIVVQELILDFFFDLFNIKTPKWYQPFIDGRRLSSTFLVSVTIRILFINRSLVYRRSGVPIEKNEPLPQRPGDAFKMRDQYIALMLLVFTKAGLLDVCQLFSL
jgi:rapamycin-insensitive companion of mTOR